MACRSMFKEIFGLVFYRDIRVSLLIVHTNMATGLDIAAPELDSMAPGLDLLTLKLGAGGPPYNNRNRSGF